MNEKLLIWWNYAEKDSKEARRIEELKHSFQDKKIKQLVKQAKYLYKTDLPELQMTGTYSFSVVHDVPTDQEDEVQPTYNDSCIIYDGKCKDYKEFLVALNTTLSLIPSSADKCVFIIKIAAELKYVNREVGARFIDDIAREVYIQTKKAK
ncbi:hypothetical protein [Bacillus thermotolerans]|uniref:Uncharacterized protein n=1 Tax=Bacillus thermotolerans TaxID=1221996 RepID=A0A0F5HSC4_BACTR|nr:hypothetical protein [Bacillus thermotolerans]KKB35752.1 hypothetical protein QY97_01550 [Bacillus thermotolerans]KKB40060.1 hypothetical protein QY95_01932 [Bacillus thermotolerans]KKB43668.1 hypothetical protein QY96_00736 [Bacillus thermotolerans]